MQLRAIYKRLRKELESTRTTPSYERAQLREELLRPYATVPVLLDVLCTRYCRDRVAQNSLLRHLMWLMRTCPDEPIWQKILLCSFLPSLIRIQVNAKIPVELADDRDAILYAAFMEVLVTYPFGPESNFIARGMVRNTKRRYWDLIKAVEDRRAEDRKLVEHAYFVGPDEMRRLLAPGDKHLNQDEREELYPRLREFRIDHEDLDLLLSTRVDKMTMNEYVKSRYSSDLSMEEVKRICGRLYRRRRLATAALEKYLERKRKKRPIFD